MTSLDVVLCVEKKGHSELKTMWLYKREKQKGKGQSIR